MRAWYLNRLKTMSVPELFFRSKQFIQKKLEEYFLYKLSPHELIAANGRIFSPVEIIPEEIYPNDVLIFGKKLDYFNEEINWHKDIFTDKCFPLIFSKNINIRNSPSLSAKNVWEINRLQFLPQVALNFKKTGSEIYLERFIEILSSWIGHNPYLVGINWYSNIEVNIRLINWVLCWEILDVERLIADREDFKSFVERKWIPSVYQHCLYSFRNPSRYSSANNHLVSEYAGLFIASSLWKFSDSVKWLRYAKSGLEEEIILQHSSGINREEAAEYIQFITDFFLLSLVVGERTGNTFSEDYRKQLHEILKYVCNFLDCKGNFPKYGDEDDGKCFIINYEKDFNNFQSLLTSGAILFKDSMLKTKSKGFDFKNWFMFGNEGKAIYEAIEDNDFTENSQSYRSEGHFIFRKKEKDTELYLHFDAAPLGYLSIAAHGHADALSFVLHVDGHPVFVDSGTYTYHTHPEWRHYFIGTLAHNTVRINKKDQAVNGGPTLWVDHYKTRILDLNLGEDVDSIKASHNGYTNENVEHIREISFRKTKNEIFIADTIILKKTEPTEVEIPFHFNTDIKVELTGKNCFAIKNDSIREMEFRVDGKLNPVVIKGQEMPQILGWYSETFMNKKATNVIYCHINISSTTIFEYLIKIN